MGFYVPEIKEEISENAKILVEENGRIVRTNLPKYEPSKSEFSGPDIVLKTTNPDNKDAYTIEKFSFDITKILNGQLTAMLVYTWWDEGAGVCQTFPLCDCYFSVFEDDDEWWLKPGKDLQISSLILSFNYKGTDISCYFNSDMDNPIIEDVLKN